jgi:hypothetical protein
MSAVSLRTTISDAQESARDRSNTQNEETQMGKTYDVIVTKAKIKQAREWTEKILSLEVHPDSGVQVKNDGLFDVKLTGLYAEQVQEIIDTIDENGSTFARPF